MKILSVNNFNYCKRDNAQSFKQGEEKRLNKMGDRYERFSETVAAYENPSPSLPSQDELDWLFAGRGTFNNCSKNVDTDNVEELDRMLELIRQAAPLSEDEMDELFGMK